jgi:hypothetical protein
MSFPGLVSAPCWSEAPEKLDRGLSPIDQSDFQEPSHDAASSTFIEDMQLRNFAPAASACSCLPPASAVVPLPALASAASPSPLPLRQRPGRAYESTLLTGISLSAGQTVTTVWRTEPGTTLIVGFNSTTVLSAYFRTCAFTTVHRKRPLAQSSCHVWPSKSGHFASL